MASSIVLVLLNCPVLEVGRENGFNILGESPLVLYGILAWLIISCWLETVAAVGC